MCSYDNPQLRYDELRELSVKMLGDSRLEAGGLAGVASFEHLPDFVQPRDDSGLFVWNFQVQQIGRASCRERVYSSV